MSRNDDGLLIGGFGQPAQNVDATGRMIRKDSPPIPQRKPETILPTAKGNRLLDFIGQLESSDNYNVIVGGKEEPLTKMSIKQVLQLQKDLIKQDKDTAMGRYQIKNSTLKEIINKLGIDEDAIFDDKLQDKLARQLLQKRGFEKYKAGKISTKEFIKELSKEWAAVPTDVSNQSYYQGIANNKALADFKSMKDLLEKP
jgi:muramidase (phage lysozyme)